MNDNFNLSNFITEINYGNCRLAGGIWIRKERVKEFVKRLLEEDYMSSKEVKETIRKLAGKELI